MFFSSPVYFCLLSLLHPAHSIKVLAVSVPDEKKTKRLLIRRLRVAALSHGITLISQAWKAKKKQKTNK